MLAAAHHTPLPSVPSPLNTPRRPPPALPCVPALPAEWANQCLQMLTLGSGASLHSLAHHHEIYPGSKLTHFQRIHERTGIAYTDMLVSSPVLMCGCGGCAVGCPLLCRGRRLSEAVRCPQVLAPALFCSVAPVGRSC